jgi:hypothetical protein
MRKVKIDLEIPKVNFNKIDQKIKSLAGEVREKMDKEEIDLVSMGEGKGFIVKLESKFVQREVTVGVIDSSPSKELGVMEGIPLLEESIAYVRRKRKDRYRIEDIIGVLELGVSPGLGGPSKELNYEQAMYIIENEWIIWSEIDFFQNRK